ncbi:MAG UNVERIFIED_CONTAM: transcriptional repressor [Anaerolineae bacterium]
MFEAVCQHDQRIGRASVFRTLDLFCQLGFAPESTMRGRHCFVLIPDGHHHHVVCLNCHCTIEFEDCALNGLAHELETRLKVQLLGHLLEFYGYCETMFIVAQQVRCGCANCGSVHQSC